MYVLLPLFLVSVSYVRLLFCFLSGSQAPGVEILNARQSYRSLASLSPGSWGIDRMRHGPRCEGHDKRVAEAIRESNRFNAYLLQRDEASSTC